MFDIQFHDVTMYSFFMWQNTDVDSEGGSLPSDSLIRSGSAGMTSTIKPIKEGYLTKKGAVVGAIRLQVLVAGMFFFFFFFFFSGLLICLLKVCFVNSVKQFSCSSFTCYLLSAYIEFTILDKY